VPTQKIWPTGWTGGPAPVAATMANRPPKATSGASISTGSMTGPRRWRSPTRCASSSSAPNWPRPSRYKIRMSFSPPAPSCHGGWLGWRYWPTGWARTRCTFPTRTRRCRWLTTGRWPRTGLQAHWLPAGYCRRPAPPPCRLQRSFRTSRQRHHCSAGPPRRRCTTDRRSTCSKTSPAPARPRRP